ncbi:hypothetical protein [Ruegeria lacuscaerulensis]|uniref:hypothetical protein n=1 Tax=Ruegeria lacuscaerulensis TaxID=55218 RepID=UPI00147E31BA|nr:hypothetical protein [Ruegeria lacuscaerulensis]
MGGLKSTAILIAFVGALAIAGGSGWKGYSLGYDAAEDGHRAEKLEMIEAAKELENERIDVAQQRANLAQEVQESINADPIVVSRCLGPSRGVQLNAPGVGR